MKIALIFPSPPKIVNKVNSNPWISKKIKKLFQLGETNYTPPLSLLMLAAMTPESIQVEIVDERFEEIDFTKKYDLVGITVVTQVSNHAYRISKRFKSLGSVVVLGGIHPSVLPEEAIQHCDTVVVGEGEHVWPQIIKDLKTNSLEKIYKGGNNQPIDDLPVPKRSILKNSHRYLTNKVVLATRGCGNSCSFCSIGLAVGKKYRKRSIDRVIEEIESIPGKQVIFADDNLGWDLEFTKELFTALIPLKISWFGGMSLQLFEHNGLIELAAKSVCTSIGIGFESLFPPVLKALNKSGTNHPEMYEQIINQIHQNGIAIMGYFIMGHDLDPEDSHLKLANFIVKNGIEMPSINLLTPYPGSLLYRNLIKENRILHQNWDSYDSWSNNLVYHPKNISPQILKRNHIEVQEKVFSFNATLERLWRAKQTNILNIGTAVGLSYQQRLAFKNQHSNS